MLGEQAVIHYSCDRCKRKIDPREELRYVVRMEVRAAMDVEDDLDDEHDRDHLMEIHELLECAEDVESEAIDDDVYQQRRFDLCPECYRKFAKNPIGREPLVEFNFSQN